MLGGRYFHKGYVTRDLGRAMESLTNLYGIRWEILDTSSGAMAMKLALGWHDNLEIELIEPLSGQVDFYREMLAEDHTPRLHHTGILVDDWESLESDIAARGLPVVTGGDLGEIKFAYVDMRAALGHYVEYMWMSEPMWAARQAGTSTADLKRLRPS